MTSGMKRKEVQGNFIIGVEAWPGAVNVFEPMRYGKWVRNKAVMEDDLSFKELIEIEKKYSNMQEITYAMKDMGSAIAIKQ